MYLDFKKKEREKKKEGEMILLKKVTYEHVL
jgi:hypothetical protein